MEKEYKNKWVKFRDNCIGELRIRNQEWNEKSNYKWPFFNVIFFC
jgi:hypothetical protein